MLDNLILPSRVNQTWQYSGMDSEESCLDKKHFKNYPHTVSYNYNSRGFRDEEWPDDLTNAIWCIGDSFTVGLGAPIEHTWPYLLEQRTGHKCINISMDGASNNWIGRRAMDIIREVNPKHIVIHWSHLHRREADDITALHTKWHGEYNRLKQKDWPEFVSWDKFNTLPDYVQQTIKDNTDWDTFTTVNDENRRLWHIKHSNNDIENTASLVNAVGTRAVHTFCPGFAFLDDTEKFYQQLTVDYVPELTILDYARDYHHYDKLTAQSLVDKILPKLV